MDTVIQVEHLRKAYGKTVAVDDISFQVHAGEIFGLLGPNGAGKTTTVECLQGLRRADGGLLRVLGLDPQHDIQKLRRRIGSQLQESALPDRLKVWEALDLFASFMPGARDWQVLMEEWGLSARRNASYGSLSGGQRQRLLVALALVNNPELVFLDEMTAGLDPAARHTAWDLIRAIRKRGTTVVLVTHFMDEAERLCDRLAIIDGGRLAALDTPQGLINRFAGVSHIQFSTEAADIRWLEQLPCVRKISRRGNRVEVQGDGAALVVVAAALVNHGITPNDLSVRQPSLEEVFLSITGHAMRE